MEQQKVEELFARASRIKPKKYIPTGEFQLRRAQDGAKRFKRIALGLGGLFEIGGSVVKGLDEMAELFCKSGIASSVDEGRRITVALAEGNASIEYGLCSGIVFEEVKNGFGERRYRVRVYAPD